MYSEYDFYDKKSDVFLSRLKSNMLDYLSAEEWKSSDIMKKLAEAEDSDMKNKLIDLCNQHKENIFRVLEAFNNLNELLQKFDDFSKNIRELENESVAEIVSNYIDQQNNEKAKQNISEEDKSVGQKKEETDSQNMDNKAEENVNQVIVDKNDEQADLNEQSQDQSELNTDQQNLDNKAEENVNQVIVNKNDEQADLSEQSQDQSELNTNQQNLDNKAEENVNQVIVDKNDEQADLSEQSQNQSELNTDQQNLDNKVEENINQVSSEKNDNEEIKPSVESEEAVHEIVPNEPVATNDGQIFSQDMMEKDNDSVVQEEIVDIFSQNKDNDATQNNNLSVENNTESVPMIIDDNLNKDNEDIQDAKLISEKNDSSDGEIASDNLSEIQDVSNVEKPVIDVTSVENVSRDSNLDNENSVINDSTDVVSNAEVTLNSESEEKIDTKEENVVSDVQSDISSNVGEIGTSIPVISESSGDDIDNNYVFEKKDSNEPKVILTTANQVSKLRNSRSNNESILTAKQFFKLEKKEDNKDLETNNMIFPEAVVSDEVSNDEVVSSENNQEMSKEKQMEMMMKQITDFYKEGKVDEAQALSDKVSELNREIQQKQKTLAA